MTEHSTEFASHDTGGTFVATPDGIEAKTDRRRKAGPEVSAEGAAATGGAFVAGDDALSAAPAPADERLPDPPLIEPRGGATVLDPVTGEQISPQAYEQRRIERAREQAAATQRPRPSGASPPARPPSPPNLPPKLARLMEI